MPKGRTRAVVGYAALALLCVTATGWAVFTGIAKLNLAGNAVAVRLGECHQKEGGKGSCTVCSGLVQNTANARTVEVSYDGHVGEIVGEFRRVRQPTASHGAL